MTNPLLPLIRRFLRLETLAHELYKIHLPYVPSFAKSEFRQFIRVEERHRRTFERLYLELSHTNTHPRFPFSVACLKIIARVVSFAGFEAICRFECRIEQRAINDYAQALQSIRHPALRRAVQRVLRDERTHGSVNDLLRQFQSEEKVHIRSMRTLFQKKISTATR